MQLSFHPDAENELYGAIDYYEKIDKRLAHDFSNEIQLTAQRITAFPNAWELLEGTIRRCLLNRFPYGVLYEKVGDEIHIRCCYALTSRAELLEISLRQ